MTTYVIRARDLIPAYTHAEQNDLPYEFGVMRRTDAGGSRTFQVPGLDQVRAAYAQKGLGLREESVPFPPRCRWEKAPGEQMVALIPVAPPILEMPFLQPGSDLMNHFARHSGNQGFEIRVIDGQGQAVPAQDPDVFTLVIDGVPEGTTPSRSSQEESFQNLAYSRVFALPALDDPEARDQLAQYGLSRVRNTLYVRLGLRHGTVSARSYLSNIASFLRIDESALSEARVRQAVMAKRTQALESLFSHLGLDKTAAARARIAARQEVIQAARQKIITNHQEIERIEARSKMGVDEATVQARADEQRRMIQSLEKVADVKFTRTHMQVTTTDLVIVDGRKRYKGGRYLIEFPLESLDSYPQVRNLTRRVRRTDHPHIQSHTCWGSLDDTLKSLMRQREYPAVIIMVIAYLEACNPGDVWGATIQNWPKV